MASKDQRFQRDLAKYTRGLEAWLDADKIHKHATVRHAKEVVNAVIGAAKAGIGPGGKGYAPRKPEYEKRLPARARWLAGEKPNMLDRKRFYWQIRTKSGKLFLCWKGPIWGFVHQGKEYGGTGHSKNPNYPERPWMHFDTPAADAAVRKMYKSTIEERTAKFNAGNLK